MHYIKPYSLTNNPQKTQALPGYQPLKITQVSHLEGQNTNALSRQFLLHGSVGRRGFEAIWGLKVQVVRPHPTWDRLAPKM